MPLPSVPYDGTAADYSLDDFLPWDSFEHAPQTGLSRIPDTMLSCSRLLHTSSDALENPSTSRLIPAPGYQPSCITTQAGESLNPKMPRLDMSLYEQSSTWQQPTNKDFFGENSMFVRSAFKPHLFFRAPGWTSMSGSSGDEFPTVCGPEPNRTDPINTHHVPYSQRERTIRKVDTVSSTVASFPLPSPQRKYLQPDPPSAQRPSHLPLQQANHQLATDTLNHSEFFVYSPIEDVFADRFCRVNGCCKYFISRRDCYRHRDTHFAGRYRCPNPSCEHGRNMSTRGMFPRADNLMKHLANNNECCAYAVSADQVEAVCCVKSQPYWCDELLDPYDPAVHVVPPKRRSKRKA